MTDTKNEDTQLDEVVERVSKKLVESGQDLEKVGKISRKDLMLYGSVVAKHVLTGHIQRERDAMAGHIIEVKEYIAGEFANDFKRLDKVFEQNVEIVAQLNAQRETIESQNQQLREMREYSRELARRIAALTVNDNTKSKIVERVGSNEGGRANNAQEEKKRSELEGGS